MRMGTRIREHNMKKGGGVRPDHRHADMHTAKVCLFKSSSLLGGKGT